MKIKDLILELSKHDPDTRVCLSGYEGGLYNPKQVVMTTVALDVNSEWYYGPHEAVTDWLNNHKAYVTEPMVHIR